MDAIVLDAQQYAMQIMSEYDRAHDFQHIIRVYNTALEICRSENSNVFIVKLAALFHDLDDRKLTKQTENYWLKRWPFFSKLAVHESALLINVINSVAYSKGVQPNCIETAIIQDADRLDAIGALGLARAFTYGGSVGMPIVSSENVQTSVNHIYEKMIKIKDSLHTTRAKEMAKERHDFLLSFIDQINRELTIGGLTIEE